MKTDWSIKPNFEKGIRIHSKPDDQQGVERIAFKMSKKQRSVLSSYCQETGLSISNVMRTALQLYFDQSGYNPPEQTEDSNQLKLYPD
jgi:hypothetical protein